MEYYDRKGRRIEPGMKLRGVGGEELLVVVEDDGDLEALVSASQCRPLNDFVQAPYVLGRPVLWEWEVL